MSRHPDNPYWCQEHDHAKAILSRAEWEEARDAGWLTADHVIGRLFNIAVHNIGTESVAGFDEDGFFISLTAAGLRIDSGVKLIVNTRDHPPPHVHVEIRGYEGRMRFNLESGELMDPVPKGWSKRTSSLRRAIRENRELLIRWWEEYHGDPVVIDGFVD